VLDEPFSGLDAINQGRLEHMIRDEAAAGTTVIFSTHVIHHAERLCERVAIIAGGAVRFEGLVSDARDRLRPHVRLKTAAAGSSRCSRRCSPARPGLRSCRSSGPACTTPSWRSPAKARHGKWRPMRRPTEMRHEFLGIGLGDRAA
jgi:energy-coupling factor transporter ATP-binding protein EcfA2